MRQGRVGFWGCLGLEPNPILCGTDRPRQVLQLRVCVCEREAGCVRAEGFLCVVGVVLFAHICLSAY